MASTVFAAPILPGKTDAWKAAYPGAHVGVLAMRDVVNPAEHAALEERTISSRMSCVHGGPAAIAPLSKLCP